MVYFKVLFSSFAKIIFRSESDHIRVDHTSAYTGPHQWQEQPRSLEKDKKRRPGRITDSMARYRVTGKMNRLVWVFVALSLPVFLAGCSGGTGTFNPESSAPVSIAGTSGTGGTSGTSVPPSDPAPTPDTDTYTDSYADTYTNSYAYTNADTYTYTDTNANTYANTDTYTNSDADTDAYAYTYTYTNTNTDIRHLHQLRHQHRLHHQHQRRLPKEP